MPYLETAQVWLSQSTLLLQARPSTTRITTKYTIKPAPTSSNSATNASLPKPKPTNETDPPRATLTLKTYDPVSGATLKYSTTKQAEVSRLIQVLGRLARGMSGQAMDVKEDGAMGVDGGEGVGTPVEAAVGAGSAVAGGIAGGKGDGKGVVQGQGQGGKKKKKGKK